MKLIGTAGGLHQSHRLVGFDKLALASATDCNQKLTANGDEQLIRVKQLWLLHMANAPLC